MGTKWHLSQWLSTHLASSSSSFVLVSRLRCHLLSLSLILVVISCHCCCPCIDCLLLHINISLIILIVDSHNMMHSPHHPLSLYPVVPFQCYHPSSSSLCNCLSCHCLPSKWFRCTSLSSLMSLVPRTSNWLLHWHGMPCWSSLSSFSSSLVLADVHRDFYWLLHSIDYWIIFAPHFPLFVPPASLMASLTVSLVIWKQHTGSSSIGNGMETARYPLNHQRCIVIRCVRLPTRQPSWPIINHSIIIPSTKDMLQSSSPSSFIRHPPPSFADKQEASIPLSSGWYDPCTVVPSTQFRRDF